MFSTQIWIGFIAFVALAILIDLIVLHKQPKEMSFKESMYTTLFWVVSSLIFAFMLHYYYTTQKALEFLTGYIAELSLSIDNIFVFLLIFTYFKVEQKYQHRILFWGIIGAIIMRLFMITIGVYMVKQIEWIFYIFGIFLIFGAYKISFSNSDDSEPDKGSLISFLKKYLRFTDQSDGDKFTIKKDGKVFFTPLFLVLILIEKTDLIFALDSIPAILAITQDTFIVFSSNIFAILGLRSLYFFLAKVINKFKYIKYGLSVILFYIGVKMIILVQGIHIPIYVSLSIILGALSLSVISSLVIKNK